MRIYLCRPVYIDGSLRTPIARYVAEGTEWVDTITADGKTVVTAVAGAVPEHNRIIRDEDVIGYLPIETEDGTPLGRNDLVRDIAPEKRGIAARMLAGKGIPAAALIGPNARVLDLYTLIQRKIELDQLLADTDFAAVRALYRSVVQRLRLAGFDVSEIAPTDTDSEIMEKLLVQSRGRN